MSSEASRTTDAEFDPVYFSRLAAASDHWWVQGMHAVGQAMLGRRAGDADVLDLGCGTGSAFGWLAAVRGSGALHACDVASAAVRVARGKAVATSVLQAAMQSLPYRDSSFDVVVNADVLQHLTADDAVAALREVRRVMRPGASLLLRVNGDSFRHGVAQRENWRLYNPGLLRSELAEAGLEVTRISFANSLPSLAAAVAGLLRRPRSGHDDHHEGREEELTTAIGIPVATGGWRSVVGRAWLRGEAWWVSSGRRRLPFGHAVVAVASRPPD